GGTSGIGRAAAKKLAQLGIHVIVVGRNAERGEKTVAEIRAAGGEADFISSDFRDASRAREVARRALELGNGHVDILINNAGIYPFGPTREMSEVQFDRFFSLNVKAQCALDQRAQKVRTRWAGDRLFRRFSCLILPTLLTGCRHELLRKKKSLMLLPPWRFPELTEFQAPCLPIVLPAQFLLRAILSWMIENLSGRVVSRRDKMAQRRQRGWLKKENRTQGETWVLYFRTTRKSDGRRVENKIPI